MRQVHNCHYVYVNIAITVHKTCSYIHEYRNNIKVLVHVVCTQHAVCNKHIPDFFRCTLELVDGILHHLGSFMLRRTEREW